MSNFDQKRTPSIQIIIAALNEEKGIGPTIAEYQNVLGRASVLVVDGKSTDRTVEVAKEMGAEVVVQKGSGKGDAIAKAIENLDPDVNYVVITDADYTYPAQSVPEMITMLQKNLSLGMVIGNRYTGYQNIKPTDTIFYFGNRLIAFAHNFLNGVPLTDPLTGLRVVRAEIIRSWKVKSKSFDVEIELNHLVERKGFRIAEVPIKYRERIGEKKLGLKHAPEIFRRIILETIY